MEKSASVARYRTTIEALDAHGYPYMREARTVCELPSVADRRHALASAASVIESIVGLECIARGDPGQKVLWYGVPVYRSFGLRLSEAKNHSEAGILLLPACDLPLSLIKDEAAESGLAFEAHEKPPQQPLQVSRSQQRTTE